MNAHTHDQNDPEPHGKSSANNRDNAEVLGSIFKSPLSERWFGGQQDINC